MQTYNLTPRKNRSLYCVCLYMGCEYCARKAAWEICCHPYDQTEDTVPPFMSGQQ